MKEEDDLTMCYLYHFHNALEHMDRESAKEYAVEKTIEWAEYEVKKIDEKN